MLDVGWSELLIIGLVAMIVVGPKELPGLMRSIGNFIHKIKAMASSFQQQFEEAVREGDIGQIRSEVEDIGREFSPDKIMGGFDRYKDDFGDLDVDGWNEEVLMKESGMEGPDAGAADRPPELSNTPDGAPMEPLDKAEAGFDQAEGGPGEGPELSEAETAGKSRK